jgi:hypothetical protein
MIAVSECSTGVRRRAKPSRRQTRAAIRT